MTLQEEGGLAPEIEYPLEDCHRSQQLLEEQQEGGVGEGLPESSIAIAMAKFDHQEDEGDGRPEAALMVMEDAPE